MYIRVLLLLVVVCSILSFSQQGSIKFNHLSVEQGLSDNSVNCFFQDSKGFIWFGTWNGLNKYDGYSFKIYRYEPGNSNSLSDFAVNAIVEDKSGMLWIATREGLNKFDPKTETFTVLKNNPDNKNSLSSNFVTALLIDNNNNLWIGTREGLNKLNLFTNTFTHFINDTLNPKSISSNPVTTILKQRDGTLWIGTSNGLNRLNKESGNFVSYINNPEDEKSISSNSILTITEDSNTGLWIGTNVGLNLYKEGKFTRFLNSDNSNSLSSNHVRSISLDKSNDLWIATLGGGLNKYSPATNKFIHFKYNKNDINSISSNLLKSIFIDNAGIIWIGTHDKGLNKFMGSQKFIHVKQEENNPTSISDNNIMSLFEDSKENIWIGTEGGLNKISAKSLSEGKISFAHFKNEINNPNSLSYNVVTSIIEDKIGNLWIGTFGRGLNKFNINKKQFKHYHHDPENPNSLSHDFIHTLYQDKQGIIWIGTGLGGLVKFDPVRETFQIFNHDPDNPETSLSTVEVTSIVEDKDGFLWVGTTTGGLNKFDRKKEIFYHFKPEQSKKNSLSSMRINTLYLDADSILWIGTFGGGLNKFNIKENTFTHYTEKEGLPSNTILGIVKDKSGNIWLSSTKGISKLSSSINNLGPEEKLFKNYDMSDGLQENEFLQNSCIVSSKTGYIYFGGINGFNFFHPDSIKEDKFVPQISIIDFKIFNKSVPLNFFEDLTESPLKNHISFTKEITLSHDDNVISFDFASLHFANPEKNQYAYKMEGFDKDWIYSGNFHSASYTNLDPGTYIFKVKGSNSDGVWNEQEASIKININPPWWRSWWAFIFYALFFLLALFTLRKYEMNRLRLKNNLERKEFETKKILEIDHMKSRFFANISHEFRTPLTLILGMLEKYLNTPPNDSSDFRIMKKNAKRLLQLINQLLELSKLESGNVKLFVKKIELYQFIRRVASSFVSFAEQKNIDLKFNELPLNSLTKENQIYVYIDHDKMETVIYNLLSNALKFTPEGEKINISLGLFNNQVEIEIKNTGSGIPEDKIEKVFDRFYQGDDSETRGFEGTGIGLSLVKEIVELHFGQVKVESLDRKETTFTVFLPLGKDHFSPEDFIDIGDKETEIEFDKIILPDNDENEIEPNEIESNEIVKRRVKELNIILIVEDHFDLRNFICEQLEKDYSVIEAEDGDKGLKLAEEIIPDLVISDIMMPKMNGYQLCRELKTNLKTNHIPVILLTAKASLENKLEGLDTGADDYLIKPFNTTELKSRVKNLIQIRQHMRDKFRSEMVLKPAEVIVPANQKVFIEKLNNIIENHIEDEKFSVEILSSEMGMSRSQLHRKVKALTSKSPNEFIRIFRLQRAADLIKKGAGNFAEISYKTGFNSQAYFTKLFQEMYGCTPTEFRKKTGETEDLNKITP